MCSIAGPSIVYVLGALHPLNLDVGLLPLVYSEVSSLLYLTWSQSRPYYCAVAMTTVLSRNRAQLILEVIAGECVSHCGMQEVLLWVGDTTCTTTSILEPILQCYTCSTHRIHESYVCTCISYISTLANICTV